MPNPLDVWWCLIPYHFPVPDGAGALLNIGGHDFYREAYRACWDCTYAPYGLVGAQLDL